MTIPSAVQLTEAERAFVDELSRSHRDSYPMGNIHHGTPDNPDWGTFCVECADSWPCDVARLVSILAARATESATVEARVRPWREGDGDTRCQECGYEYRPWFTDNSLWNEVQGGSAYGGDPGGYLCARCFTDKADGTFPGLVWRVIPQWNRRAERMDWPIADAAASVDGVGS